MSFSFLALLFCIGRWGLKEGPIYAPLWLQKTGFTLQEVWVEGRNRTSLQDLREAAGISRGDPIFAKSPETLQKSLQELPWIHTAVVKRRLPSSLYICLVEREPLALWQKDGKKKLLDTHGQVIPCDPKEHTDALVTLVGNEAPQSALEFLRTLEKFPSLRGRVQAASRLRSGRWDLYLKEKTVLKLPLEGLSLALEKFTHLENQNVLSAAGFQTIDLRFSDRIIVQACKKTKALGRA